MTKTPYPAHARERGKLPYEGRKEVHYNSTGNKRSITAIVQEIR